MSKLYLIPTPIGNLEDITLRALRVLKEVDIVLAEDTRTTKKLFSNFEIITDLSAFHMHNEHKVLQKWVESLKKGKYIALVSDAGTPAISDPGFLLVRECIKEGIDVDCFPGATACIPALVNSGLPCDKFIFEGFLPVKKGRQTRMKILAQEERTMIFYESPHRIIKTLNQFAEFFGKDRSISVSREISKIFEETIRGTINEVLLKLNQKKPKGEFVIVVAGKE
ncbi:16S rRNA (cytidine(1402)-2'-O)-methyltransferase [Flavobacteriales bacterium]|nr:16S rRNA (cytidine(1402)-2'-O)-methyltransferase [Flavobacteriales bacterium]